MNVRCQCPLIHTWMLLRRAQKGAQRFAVTGRIKCEEVEISKVVMIFELPVEELGRQHLTVEDKQSGPLTIAELRDIIPRNVASPEYVQLIAICREL